MTMTRDRIFISSVHKEFAQVRRDLKVFFLGDAVLCCFVSDVFLFEELPARYVGSSRLVARSLAQR